MRYFFPLHYDGGNRGCEAIAKGSAMLLGVSPENLIAYCRDTELDHRLKVDRYVTLLAYEKGSFVSDRILAAINKIFHTETTLRWRLLSLYKGFLNKMTAGDVMLSTGGDMMCYGNNEIIYTNDYVHSKGFKTILWGCSMGPENLTPEKRETLFNYSLVYARESLTYDFLKGLGIKNICLCPDPAFVLPSEECRLPGCMDNGNVLGLNLSSYVMGDNSSDGPFANEVFSLIDHILHETDLHILLIPHVTWNFGDESQDDRLISESIRSRYQNSERISVLDISDKNYCQIRYVIGKCRFFIGARTHSVISAYSMCVPTLALGYSIKSKGIARDLNLEKELVVDSRHVMKGQLMNSFIFLQKNEEKIRQTLELEMPAYKESTYQIRKHLAKL